MKFKHFLYITITFLIAGCSEEDSSTNNPLTLNLGLYKVSVNSNTGARTTSTLEVDSISAKGVNHDSLIYNNTKNLSELSLPLKNSGSSNIISSFEVTFNNVKDTITIIHENFVSYVSLDKGCVMTYRIDTILTTNHYIDSAKILIHEINNNSRAKQNIKLYN